MATAKKLPSGQWRVRVYIGMTEEGKKQYKSITRSTKKEAEREAALFEVAELPKIKSSNSENNAEMTLKEACDKFIEYRKNVLSPNTVPVYKRTIKNDLAGITDKKINSITPELVQRHFNEYCKTHSSKSARNALSFLKKVLKTYGANAVMDIQLPQKEKTEIVIPTDEQFQEAVSELRGTDMGLVIMLSGGLGLRRAEICALTWADVQDGVLRINKALALNEDGEWVEKAPKTMAGNRSIPIPESIQQCIDQMHTPEKKMTDRIFSLTPNAVTRRWERLCEKKGFKCRFHDLRHYNASTMLALGIPDLYAMQRMGHSTTNMLKTVYQHIQDNKKAEVDHVMSDRINLLLK